MTHYRVWIDEIVNTVNGGDILLTGFEGYAQGDEVVFQDRRSRGARPPTSRRCRTWPPSPRSLSFAGSASYLVEFEFVDDIDTRWVRLTTFQTPTLPNPTIAIPGDGTPTETSVVTLRVRVEEDPEGLDPDIEVAPLALASVQPAGVTVDHALHVGNVGGANLEWPLAEANVDCGAPLDVPWVSVQPTAGTTAPAGSDELTVTFDSIGQAPGDYSALLCISSNDPDEPVVPVALRMTVQGSVLEIPTTSALGAALLALLLGAASLWALRRKPAR
ncbi:MAG TPA: IPTL-CTERM sorting domain-containing protein [Thermoanaerobaculia bacterium]|nr:IPTL-CTERM sorting domain-containing protein [Thermoanaerobaculia bacterium]